MNKHLKYILVGFLICLQSCSFQDDSLSNQELNETTEFELMISAMFQMAFNQSALPGRTFAGFMQYLNPSDTRIVFFNYNVGSEYFDDMWVQGYYGGSLASANEMKRLAEENGNDLAVAVSLILLANEFGNLTNVFGDIPFTEALEGNQNIFPSYDSQEEVYQGILQMLDEAIALIGSNGFEDSLLGLDLIFSGEMQSWVKLANGLKARLLLNQNNRVPGMEAEILSLIDNSFTDRKEQADFEFFNLWENPLHTFGETRPSSFFISEYFANILLTTDDPRLDTYADSDFPEWNYHGTDELVWAVEDSVIPILSYTELMFMKAEVLLQSGASSDEVELVLKDAILNNMEDNRLVIDSDVENFVSIASNLDGLNETQILEKIISSAYVSYYGYNFLQSWNNYRRTGYPELPDAGFTPGENNPSNVVPRRLRYVQNEIDFNSTNVQEAISRQDGDLLDDDIWIFR